MAGLQQATSLIQLSLTSEGPLFLPLSKNKDSQSNSSPHKITSEVSKDKISRTHLITRRRACGMRAHTYRWDRGDNQYDPHICHSHSTHIYVRRIIPHQKMHSAGRRCRIYFILWLLVFTTSIYLAYGSCRSNKLLP